MIGPREILSALVAVPSPSGEEEAVARTALAFCAELGLEAELVERSVLARVGRGGRGPRLLLASHLDTVPVGEGWTSDPFSGAWRAHGGGARLVARGANDAKGCAAAMLAAAAELARGGRLGGTLFVALNAEEETTNRGIGDVLARLAETGEKPDGAVVGEPTGLEVVRAQTGLAVLEARWRGVSCHAAHVAHVPNESALRAAARDLAALPPYLVLEGEHPLLGASTMVATVLRAGDRHNRVPDEAVCTFDARLAPPHDAAECTSLLAARLPGAEVRVRSERIRPVETEEGHPLVRAALAAAGRARAIGSRTASDMALLGGIPAVKCGPGETARSHTADEYLDADELERGAAFYRAVVPAALEALAALPSVAAFPGARHAP